MMDSTTTTDRELLELAAKAAKMDYLIWTPGSSPLVPSDLRVDGRVAWNPLADDGDALRLAVKLEIQILRNIGGTVSGVGPATGFWDRLREPLEPDPYAATRRAIVRAAAEIGRSQHDR